MATLLDYKCPACGGALQFESAVQKMKCPYCNTELEMEALLELDEALQNPTGDDMQWQSQPQGQWEEADTQRVSTYICNSCGGQILCDETTAATSCPYCDNPVVMVRNVSGQLRPDLVIPFQLDKEAAKQALKKHLSGKLLLPKLFRSENRLEQIKGIYVPFWLFDAKAQGDARYRATRMRVWRDSRYEYTQTSHFSIHRAGRLAFAGVPVDGSSKMADDLMESIEPYDLSKAVDFQTAYLAGFLADKYDVSSGDSIVRANDRIKNSMEQELYQTVLGYHTVTPVSSSTKLSDSAVRYALYPVWLLTTNYKGKTYQFAMNGQTGKFVGDLPVDWGRFFAWWGAITAAVTAIAYGISFLL